MFKFILFSLFFLSFSCFSQDLNDFEVNKISLAIFKAEGGWNTKYYFGIKSIKIKGSTKEEKYNYAHKICCNTIKHKYKDWLKINNNKISFITYLGSKYAPISDSKLNYNWIKNVNFFLTKDNK